MNDRIRELRKALGLTLEKFGERIGVTKMTISRIEKGVNNVTDQMFKSICREFNVNEEWLRTGNGSMFNELSQKEQITKIVENALSNSDEFVKNAFIALGKLKPEDWKVIEKLIDGMIDLNSKVKDKTDNFPEIPDTLEELDAMYPDDSDNSDRNVG